MWIALLILVVAAALVLAGCKATRAGCESAP
jgi:predicted small secreted protein